MPCLLRQESDTAKPFADFFETLLTVFRFFKPTDRPTDHPHETRRELGEETRTPKHFANGFFFAIAREPSSTEAEGLSLSLRNDSPAAFRRETESVSFQGGFSSSSPWVVSQSANKLQFRKPQKEEIHGQTHTRVRAGKSDGDGGRRIKTWPPCSSDAGQKLAVMSRPPEQEVGTSPAVL